MAYSKYQTQTSQKGNFSTHMKFNKDAEGSA